MNGTPSSFFPSSRGLHQGDPFSPYLFVIAIKGAQLSLEEGGGWRFLIWLLSAR